MKRRIALNVFYTVGIIVSVLGIKWAFQNHNYAVGALFIATTIFFFYLKIKLTKEFRQEIKNRTNQP
ncbi:DUF6358 family protein [Pedobacter nutrimenti]|jgi:Flp pilus assembly protein TadB|uniref:Uncharacterized protein n=1 Tax=Pedobacter nutrimenti TaxID=1241337 RepID=A0A318UKI5_9SPHI|nr:DUF6358 family protein [Pedobacter nutrimenti]PYF75887.1 hypothetical protein B0O44_102442 [Pedobacter nutrimenti]